MYVSAVLKYLPTVIYNKIPSKLEVAPHALKMWTGWMDGWMSDTSQTVTTTRAPTVLKTLSLAI